MGCNYCYCFIFYNKCVAVYLTVSLKRIEMASMRGVWYEWLTVGFLFALFEATWRIRPQTRAVLLVKRVENFKRVFFNTSILQNFEKPWFPGRFSQNSMFFSQIFSRFKVVSNYMLVLPWHDKNRFYCKPFEFVPCHTTDFHHRVQKSTSE